MATPFAQVLERERGDARPPLPVGGIPRQRLPRAIRLAINLCVVPFLIFEQQVRRATQLVLRPQFRRTGRCARTGGCCRYILVRFSPLESRLPFLRRLASWWAEELNGFFPREVELQVEEGDDVRIYSCRHLTSTGTCDSYWSRPSLCREWPAQTWFGEPLVLKGCGYTFVAPDGTETTKRPAKLPILE